MTTQASAVSVLIVNFNAGEALAGSIEAALASSLPVEVIVVDNASTDDSLERLHAAVGDDPRVLLLRNDTNRGFAAATNQALARATGDWLLLLNPDCVVGPRTLERVQEALLARPDAGLAGCLLLNPDGSEQVGCRRRLPTPERAFARAFGLQGLLRHWRRPGGEGGDFVMAGEALPEAPSEVEAISGAFMLARRAALSRVGPLDEGYFLHCEDLDWCARFAQAGFAVLFVPDATAVHDKGRCSRERPVFVLWHMHRGMLRFYRKFFRSRYPLPLFWLVVCGVWLRFAALTTGALLRHGGDRAPGR